MLVFIYNIENILDDSCKVDLILFCKIVNFIDDWDLNV